MSVVRRFRSALDAMVELPLDALTVAEDFVVVEQMHAAMCQIPVVQHRAIGHIARLATVQDVGKSLKNVLADRLRIRPGEAGRMIADAEILGERVALTGEVLPPLWPATAAAQRRGAANPAHVAEIGRFFHRLPSWVDAPARADAEKTLAELATKHRPDELRALAEKLADCLNPDGNFTDEDRARVRGITIGRQDADGMSAIKGLLDPPLRAALDAVLSKWAAPGMCNPEDQSPTIDGAPCDEAIRADHRSQAQRNHDALGAMCRSTLSSGELGSHHGLPVGITVSTTLQELESAAGIARTGGGSWLPIPDLIRMASHARHYLRIYDKHTSRELYLGETKRIASGAQRIVLHAKDRGCTAPGCTVPGYLCEVHHVDEWATHHRTDIDTLTFVCGPHHRLLDDGWKTRKRTDGVTEWIPPPGFDFGKPRTNGYWHPERYLRGDKSGDDDVP